MNIFEKLFAAAEALQAGKSLQDPAKWKNRGALAVSFNIILSVGFKFMGLEIDEQTTNMISIGFAALAVILHNYFTVATTDKLGIGKK